MTASLYSPLFPLIGSAVFATLAIGMYVHSQYRMVQPDIAVSSLADMQGNGVLFYLFYLGFFLSITIPKSGKTVGGIPITISNIIILATLACWCITLLVFQRSLSHIPLVKPLMSFILYGMAAALIGLVNQNNRKAVILDFVAFIGFIPLYFLVCQVLRTKKHLNMTAIAIVVGIFLVCGYGVLQTRYGFERVAIPGLTEQYGKIMFEGVGRWNVIEGGGQKVYSTFQNGNIFGHHLATFIPFLGGFLLAIPSSKKRWFGFGVFVLSFYVLILTYSRGAMAGTICGIFALGIVAKKIRLKALLIILLVVSIIGVFLYQYADRPELTRYDIRRIATDPDRFSAGRLGRAEQVLAGFYGLPLTAKFFGLGFGGILTTPWGWQFEYVDNLYLSLLFKMGLVGMALLFWVMFAMFWTLLRLRSQITNVYYLGLINGGVAGIFAALVHNLADTLWFFPPLSANFWFLVGITMAIAMIGSREAAQEPELVPQISQQAVRKFNLRENRRGVPVSA